MSKLYPSHAKTVLRCRSKCLDIKTHRPFLFKDKLCRWCNLEEETLSHIVDCGRDDIMESVDIGNIDVIDELVESSLISLSTRVNNFLEMVDC